MKQTSLEIKIDWSELDLFGHVNNVMFFKYMQASRLHFCEKIGLTSLNEENKLSFMVASSHCDFKKPLYYPGTVTIVTTSVEFGNTSFVLQHTIVAQNGETVAEGIDTLVLYDYGSGKKVTLCEELKNKMRAGA